MALRGANLRALIQGRASSWQDHLILTPLAGSGGVLSSGLTLKCCRDVSNILQIIVRGRLQVPASLQVKVWNIWTLLMLQRSLRGSWLLHCWLRTASWHCPALQHQRLML